MTKRDEQNDRSDIAVIKSQVNDIKDNVKDIKSKLEADYVTQDQFDPIKRLVYGTVALVLTTMALTVAAIIIKK